MRWSCCLALTLALSLGTLVAQEPPTLTPGTRVRVSASDGREVGWIVSMDSAAIVVRRLDGRAVNL